jgi:hypothetical protein
MTRQMCKGERRASAAREPSGDGPVATQTVPARGEDAKTNPPSLSIIDCLLQNVNGSAQTGAALPPREGEVAW